MNYIQLSAYILSGEETLGDLAAALRNWLRDSKKPIAMT